MLILRHLDIQKPLLKYFLGHPSPYVILIRLTSSNSYDVSPTKISWHHPSLTISPSSEMSPPILTSSGVVPLLLPYPSLSHSVVYMNPFIPPPCQNSTLTEKKKRNRTFIDPVSEVLLRKGCPLVCLGFLWWYLPFLTILIFCNSCKCSEYKIFILIFKMQSMYLPDDTSLKL